MVTSKPVRASCHAASSINTPRRTTKDPEVDIQRRIRRSRVIRSVLLISLLISNVILSNTSRFHIHRHLPPDQRPDQHRPQPLRVLQERRLHRRCQPYTPRTLERCRPQRLPIHLPYRLRRHSRAIRRDRRAREPLRSLAHCRTSTSTRRRPHLELQRTAVRCGDGVRRAGIRSVPSPDSSGVGVERAGDAEQPSTTPGHRLAVIGCAFGLDPTGDTAAAATDPVISTATRAEPELLWAACLPTTAAATAAAIRAIPTAFAAAAAGTDISTDAAGTAEGQGSVCGSRGAVLRAGA